MRVLLAAAIALSACLGAEPAGSLDGRTHRVVRGDPTTYHPDNPPEPRTLGPAPAIAGGTLLALSDGHSVFASDPDTDMVWMMDIFRSDSLVGLELPVGDEPGRAVQDSAGNVHVLLRRGGAVLSIDRTELLEPKVAQRRDVCAEPRGIAYDALLDRIHITCSDGQLVTLPAGAGPEISRFQLDDDLRDVSLIQGGFLISRFHSAELLAVDEQGHVVSRGQQPSFVATTFNPDGTIRTRTLEPGVAWRTVMTPMGPAMTYQRAQAEAIALTAMGADAGFGGSSPYGGGGGSLCSSGVVDSVLQLPGQSQATHISGALPVDVAINGPRAVVITAGNNSVTEVQMGVPSPPDACLPIGQFSTRVMGQPVGVAFAGTQLVVQTRNPSGLQLNGGTSAVTRFPVQPVLDPGHQMFHAEAPAGLACASCHPEGRDDGRVWHFLPDGARRTQNLSGGLSATAPFHWDGTLPTIHTLLDEVLVRRMGAPTPTFEAKQQLMNWVDTIPKPGARHALDDTTKRGATVFESAGCTSCHLGEHFTNNVSMNVGTGGSFQVPSLLGVGARAPYLHDGCAKTLEDRFGKCGGGDLHGKTSGLTTVQVTDLIAYLKTL